jgi:hypothetical protein
VFEEKYMWHDPGNLPGTKWTEPAEHWENALTKRRLHGLVTASGLIDKLNIIKCVFVVFYGRFILIYLSGILSLQG